MSRYSQDGTPSDDPRAQKTRHILKQALIELMGIKEFALVSVSDLTRAADINRATFYSHFADKNELLDSIVAETFTQMMTAYTGDNLKLNDETLHTFIMSVWEYMGFFRANIGGASGQKFESLIQAEVQAQIEKLISVWLETEIADDALISVNSAAIAGAIFNSGANQGRVENNSDANDMAMNIRNLIIHGLKHSRFTERDTLS